MIFIVYITFQYYCHRVEEINFIDHTTKTTSTTLSSDDDVNNNNTNSIGDDDVNNNVEKRLQYQLQAINTVTNEKLRISCTKLVVATDPTSAKVIINEFFSKKSATTTTTTTSTDYKEDVFKIPRGRGYVK